MGRSVRTHVWKQIDQSWSIPIIWTRSDHSLDQSSRNKSNEKYLNSKCLPKVASLADRDNEGYEKKEEQPFGFQYVPLYGRGTFTELGKIEGRETWDWRGIKSLSFEYVCHHLVLPCMVRIFNKN